MPNKKETQDQAIVTQGVLSFGDSGVIGLAVPLIEATSPLWVVLDKKDGDGDDHICATLQQQSKSQNRILRSEKNQNHDRVPKVFRPSLQCHERKIRPKDSHQTINEVNREPSIVIDHRRKFDTPQVQDAYPGGDKSKVHHGVERTP